MAEKRTDWAFPTEMRPRPEDWRFDLDGAPTAALLEQNPHPTEDEIRWGISGNLCRCTGYTNIIKAVQYAAEKMAES